MTINLEDFGTVDDLNNQSTVNLVAIAQSHTDPEILIALARHSNALVRAAVAGNPNITNEIRKVLGNDAEETVRNTLSNNKANDVIAKVIKNIREEF
ncbi:MAG: hypothetical protein Q8P68_05770 [Candidatus Peregrinibacteria bacterium]|nr:hypothetical protein [Candidatus Peregrinibacteria bacterium]MDZ4244984.1 hypothetical protein [Candidatus Gracilibacteria bacterium]